MTARKQELPHHVNLFSAFMSSCASIIEGAPVQVLQKKVRPTFSAVSPPAVVPPPWLARPAPRLFAFTDSPRWQCVQDPLLSLPLLSFVLHSISSFQNVFFFSI